MSKRRIFDIDFPEDPPAPKQAVPGGTAAASEAETRRGPMAAAITENAEALRERAEAEQAIREENDRLAHEHVRLKKQGLITDLIPLDAILTTKLTRDRSDAVDPDLEDLKASIQSIGLSNPIRVEPDGDKFQLVQGFRRLSAYRALHEESGDETYARIPAGLVAQGEELEGLYRRMVDENLVRRDLSFAEMAQLAIAYVRDPDTQGDSIQDAVATLYASAGRQKRAYIRHFASLLDQIGDYLKFPEAIPRALGLDLEKRLSDHSGSVTQLQGILVSGNPTSADAELAVLRSYLDGTKGSAEGRKPSPSTSAKTTLRCASPSGSVRLSARNGKVELAADVDFSSIDRHRLEEAVAAFMSALEK
ncbi:ParB N-terminal domain-containing protein [Shimia thalassica]|uniref:ParB N-terminal domain-containing protein n=1 Tax=Shimia thalassica TaxID=1715693 RepID=UPI0026E29409|nr:ParB N-terminal domain-containing protein [Shimia thalassica]MDO6481888.1 ParB N-terminal domain-containing protein [Shimia thalassica]